MELIGSPETSVSKCLTPRNNPEEGRVQSIRGEAGILLPVPTLSYFKPVKAFRFFGQ
jgi:hypothetical protein